MATAIQNTGLGLMAIGTALGFVWPLAFNVAAAGFLVFAIGMTLGIGETICRERK